MKFLVDECVNNKSEYHGSKEFQRTVDVLGCGTKDPVILKFIKNKRIIPITKDWWLMLRAIQQGNKVIFINSKNESIMIKAITQRRIFIDPVTYDAMKNDRIIIP